MEMSPQYAEETATYAASRGYALDVSRAEKDDRGVVIYRSTRYRLVAEGEAWVLEVARYTEGDVRYFLEIEHHGFKSRSFPLDSWKYRHSHIEFRYGASPESGLALTFELRYPDRHPTPPCQS